LEVEFIDDSEPGDPSHPIREWHRDFGDGESADGLYVSHAYNQPGDYQITLTVTDNDQLTGETTHPIQIDEAAPANLPPTEIINGG
jgi:PKD repeat protein